MARLSVTADGNVNNVTILIVADPQVAFPPHRVMTQDIAAAEAAPNHANHQLREQPFRQGSSSFHILLKRGASFDVSEVAQTTSIVTSMLFRVALEYVQISLWALATSRSAVE